MLVNLSPSLRYVAAANRAPRDPGRLAAIEAATPLISDWHAVLAIGEQHRVMPLLADALCRAPVSLEIRHHARATARDLARRSLLQLAEIFRIGAAFDASGIDWLTFKGPVLAIQAYSDVSAKMSHDLDLLIAPSDTLNAFDCMRALGYLRVDGPGKADPRAFERYFKDSLWRRPDIGGLVELHTRFFETAELLPGFGLHSPRERVAAGRDRTISTLARPELLVYLSVHGARTNWYRLKWLADFAALTGRSVSEDIEAARVRAAEVGVLDIFDSALILANELFDSPLPAEAGARNHKRRVHMLVRSAIQELSAPYAQTQRNPNWKPSLIQYLGPLRVSNSWRYRIADVRRLLADPVAIEQGATNWQRWSSPLRVLFRFAGRIVRQIAKPRRTPL
ncbi:nucleotidyltransferase family protein [Sphingomonas sp. ST-64]|uniref:Nucleotidyltransferase family protein n=1 Tax=Sphingomonas plantiphila TaxID=3163295 RepID=A0ABW8YIU9_9SPHN